MSIDFANGTLCVSSFASCLCHEATRIDNVISNSGYIQIAKQHICCPTISPLLGWASMSSFERYSIIWSARQTTSSNDCRVRTWNCPLTEYAMIGFIQVLCRNEQYTWCDVTLWNDLQSSQLHRPQVLQTVNHYSNSQLLPARIIERVDEVGGLDRRTQMTFPHRGMSQHKWHEH